ncbi:PaaX family transcriptional regulator C-terminal domain-containing protein [Nocardioides sp.]|uniref:PaaX family transcriptional regulator C-terminal domain-containing protein n=1 Tax=Nocardioides sp. TaxID=35761 RepID=UPI00286AB3DD|nr:PaaX family transcriptional regulator C-terminal domain-containing protein [Nocardioides sp.]
MKKRPPKAAQRDLSVRSAVLSVLLGAHPEVISPSRLVEAAAFFDMSESGVRVALTRAVASGDLRRTKDGYALGERLLKRQQRQAEAVAPDPSAWDGLWETAIVVAAGRSVAERSSLRLLLAEHRLAELREGVWLRPANLAREPRYVDHPDLTVCETRHSTPRDLAEVLWDLGGWDDTGRQILTELDSAEKPLERLAVAARMVHHLASDPILPHELLPATWVGGELRAAYAAYQQELRHLA